MFEHESCMALEATERRTASGSGLGGMKHCTKTLRRVHLEDFLRLPARIALPSLTDEARQSKGVELSGVDALLIHLPASNLLHYLNLLGHPGTSPIPRVLGSVCQPKILPGQRSAALLHAPLRGSSGWWRSTCLAQKGSLRLTRAAGQVEVHNAALQPMPDLLQRLRLVVLHGATAVWPVVFLEPRATGTAPGCLLRLLSITRGGPVADLALCFTKQQLQLSHLHCNKLALRCFQRPRSMAFSIIFKGLPLYSPPSE